VPVALIIAGSGPVDRNGNGPGLQSDTYKLLAQALAARGVANIRYDKRGVGASAFSRAHESSLRFEMYINDAAGWQKQLRADKRFSKIVVAGHSEGSLIGMISSQHAPADAFASLEGAGRPAAAVLLEQLKARLQPEVFQQAVPIVAALQAGRTVPVQQSWAQELQMLFRASVQPYLISWFKYDPAKEIAKLQVPVTIVQGTADVQVSMTDANALKAALPAAHMVVVNGMNHILRYAPDTSSMQAVLAGYQNASLPIDSHVVDALASMK
jgi:pimeloyl-ACP methyl ester carboxylesterase